MGADASEGIVSIDLEPSDEVKARFDVIPKVEEVQLNTPFWMSYYDASENYMYVHSIEKLRGEVYGASASLKVLRGRQQEGGEKWRSWRLLDAADLAEVSVVTVNYGTEAGHHDRRPLHPGRPADRGADAGLRSRYSCTASCSRRTRSPRTCTASEYVRIGLDPMLTENGKPYVMMRYGDGPLSLHHG